MSYSFTAQGATKDEIKQQVAAKFADVLTSQPVHAVDLPTAQSTAEAFIDLLEEPGEGQQFSASISGYVSWRGQQDEAQFTGANVSIGISMVAKA